MKPIERVLNLFILFFLFVLKTGYEFYMNKVPFHYMLDIRVFYAPIIFTFTLGYLGEVLLWIKENKNLLIYEEEN